MRDREKHELLKLQTIAFSTFNPFNWEYSIHFILINDSTEWYNIQYPSDLAVFFSEHDHRIVSIWSLHLFITFQDSHFHLYSSNIDENHTCQRLFAFCRLSNFILFYKANHRCCWEHDQRSNIPMNYYYYQCLWAKALSLGGFLYKRMTSVIFKTKGHIYSFGPFWHASLGPSS